MHVHLAFELARYEDLDAPWGEGIVTMDDKDLSTGDARKALKIAPGHGAEYWDDCRENGYIRVGWATCASMIARTPCARPFMRLIIPASTTPSER